MVWWPVRWVRELGWVRLVGLLGELGPTRGDGWVEGLDARASYLVGRCFVCYG